MIHHDSSNVIEELCCPGRGVNPETLEQIILVSVEIAREGREGRKIGTLFVVGDTDNVLRHSKCLILDPLKGHEDEEKRISNSNMRETVKELAQLDGGFVVSNDGVVVSAARFFDTQSKGLNVPLGLGGRHMAAASITKQTRAVAVVVSESSVVRLFDDGDLVSEILPEIWMLRQYGFHLAGPNIMQKSTFDLTVVSKVEESVP